MYKHSHLIQWATSLRHCGQLKGSRVVAIMQYYNGYINVMSLIVQFFYHKDYSLNDMCSKLLISTNRPQHKFWNVKKFNF